MPRTEPFTYVYLKEFIMFCKNCGAQIDDRAVICPKCGVATDNYCNGGQNGNASSKKPTNWYAIWGLVLGLVGLFGGGYVFCIMPVLGIIFSALGLKRANQTEDQGVGLAVGGIVVSVFATAIWLFVWILAFILIAQGYYTI